MVVPSPPARVPLGSSVIDVQDHRCRPSSSLVFELDRDDTAQSDEVGALAGAARARAKPSAVGVSEVGVGALASRPVPTSLGPAPVITCRPTSRMRSPFLRAISRTLEPSEAKSVLLVDPRLPCLFVSVPTLLVGVGDVELVGDVIGPFFRASFRTSFRTSFVGHLRPVV